MQDIKQQLTDVGLSVTLKITETGQMVNLDFPRGKPSKHVTASLGPVQVEGELELVEVKTTGTEHPNLTLVLKLKQPPVPEAKKEEPQLKGEPQPQTPKAEEPKPPEEKPAPVEEQKPQEPALEEPPPAVSIPVETEQKASIPLTKNKKR